MTTGERVLFRATLYSRGLYLAYLLRVSPIAHVIARAGRPDRLGVGADCARTPEDAAALVDRLFGRWTLPFTSRCLVESLLLFALLHPVVPGVRLHIGLNVKGKHPFSVTGHAWVSVDGRPLLTRDWNAPAVFQPVTVVAGSHVSSL